MIVKSTDNLMGCRECGYTGKRELEDGRQGDCQCVETRKRRMEIFRPLIDRCNLELYRQMTFDNFLPQNETQVHAFNVITGLFSGWYLFGDYGVGKTHLMASLVNDLNSKNVPAVIFTEKDIMKIMGFTRNQQDAVLQRLLEQVRYLVIDDLGTEWQTQPVRAKIYQLIDKRYLLAQAPQGHTSFATQIPFDKLEDVYDGRVVDRILGMTMQAVITGASMRKKPDVKHYKGVGDGI